MDINNIDLEQLPSIDFEDRKQLPEVSGIYFAIDSNDNIQYIGQSINIRNRLQTHHRKQQLSELAGVRIAYLEVSDTSLLYDIEQALIDYFNPYLNGTGNKYKPDKVQVATYVTKEVKEQFFSLCESKGIKPSTVIRQFIYQYLKD